jgi:Bacterial SH3 domain
MPLYPLNFFPHKPARISQAHAALHTGGLRRVAAGRAWWLAFVLAALVLASCKHMGPMGGEVMYVSAPEASLRDHVAAIYTRVGTVKNGDRVVVLERQRRFVRVRTAQKEEGWVELRALVPSETYDQFQQLSRENRNAPIEGTGVTHTVLNMHTAPARDADALYQLPEGAKVEMLQRATSVRATREEIFEKRDAELARMADERPRPVQGRHSPPSPPPTHAPQANSTAQPPRPMDDWWLVRDPQGHTGWVLARMVDLDIPLDVAQYAEGQRIQAAFVLDTVQDEEKGAVPQYLVLLNQDHNGIAYDFNQVRVFTWNLKRHRYETAFRDHYIIGYFPVVVSKEDFGREGVMPVFTVRLQNQDGSITPRKYRLIGNIVRPVLGPGEVIPPAAHSPDEPKKLLEKKPGHVRHPENHGRKH